MSRLPVTPSCIAFVTLFGCHDASRFLPPAHATIGGEVVARVADVDVPASLVADVAAARRVSPAEALQRLIDDAIAAKYALAHGMDRASKVRFASMATLARATIDRVKADAGRTPPSDDEVRALSEAHWLEVDAPEVMVAVHAVARRPKKPDAHAEAAARAVAAAIASAVAGATDPADFETRAKAVPHPDVEVVVQPLDPFTADGRWAVPGSQGGIDTAFASAAAALSAPGATSGVVESPFGWHVIRLVERRPKKFVPFEERRSMFAREVLARRSHEAIDGIEKRLREREGVSLANGLDDLLAQAVAKAPSPGASAVAPADP